MLLKGSIQLRMPATQLQQSAIGMTWGKHALSQEEVTLSPNDISAVAPLVEHAALLTIAIEVDSVIKERFGNHTTYEPRLNQTAWFFRSLRNAYSHEPLDPKWVWNSKCCPDILEIPNLLTLPIKELHERSVLREHYHGPAGMFRLVEHVEFLVANPPG